MRSHLYEDTVPRIDALAREVEGLGVLAGLRMAGHLEVIRKAWDEAEDRHDQQVMLLERAVEEQEAA